jgi:hypothetical protein
MKLHRPVTSVFPAALAAASITLSLLLIPAGGSSLRSSGVAPALRLVAGDVATVIEKPVQAVTRAHHKSAPPPASTVRGTQQRTPVTHHVSSQPRAHRTPAHKAVGHHKAPSAPRAVAKRRVTTLAATRPPKAIAPAAKHGHGKALGHAKKAKAWGRGGKPKSVAHAAPKATAQPVAPTKNHGKGKALGHVKKPKSTPPAVTNAAAQPTAPTATGRGHAYGHSAGVPHGPPAVPPGHERGGKK